MTFTHERGGVKWLDLENPTSDEIRAVVRELDIGPRIEDELLSPTPSPLVTTDEEGTLLVLHFPTLSGNIREPRDQEIDFIVGPHFVVTVRYEVVAALHEFRKLLETGELMNPTQRISADTLLTALLGHLFRALRTEADDINLRLKKVEREMFVREPRHTVRPISNLNREFLHFEAALSIQEEPLARFLAELAHRNIFPMTFHKRVSDLLAERAQVARIVSLMRAVATELREANTSLLNTQQNEIMKVLTIMAFVTFPLTLIAAIFSMDTTEMPIVGQPHDFWIIIGMMAVMMLAFFGYFRYKHWI